MIMGFPIRGKPLDKNSLVVAGFKSAASGLLVEGGSVFSTRKGLASNRESGLQAKAAKYTWGWPIFSTEACCLLVGGIVAGARNSESNV